MDIHILEISGNLWAPSASSVIRQHATLQQLTSLSERQNPSFALVFVCRRNTKALVSNSAEFEWAIGPMKPTSLDICGEYELVE